MNTSESLRNQMPEMGGLALAIEGPSAALRLLTESEIDEVNGGVIPVAVVWGAVIAGAWIGAVVGAYAAKHGWFS